MTAARTIQHVTADVIRSGDADALIGVQHLLGDFGTDVALRLLTVDDLPAGSKPGPARLAVRLYDRLVMCGPLVGTLGHLAEPLHATRAELADALEILAAHGQAAVAVDGTEITVTRIEFAR